MKNENPPSIEIQTEGLTKRQIYARKYYTANREKILCRQKAALGKRDTGVTEEERLARREKNTIAKRLWISENRERAREINRNWTERNPDYNKEACKSRYYADVEKSRANQRTYQRINRDKLLADKRARNLKKNYGISMGDFEKMFVSQQGLCAVCRKPEKGKTPNGHIRRLSMDHWHDGDKSLRELLCGNCNTALGLVKENPETLRSLLAYLEKHTKIRHDRQTKLIV